MSTLTESWPSDGTTISTGQDNPWSEDTNDVEVSSGKLRAVTMGAAVQGRCTTNLATANNRHTANVQITQTANSLVAGVMCRKIDSAVNTCYRILVKRQATAFRRLEEVVAGSNTILASDATDIGAGAVTMYVEAVGDQIKGGVDATTFGPVTNSTISGHLQCGYFLNAGLNPQDMTLDSHTLEDVGRIALNTRSNPLGTEIGMGWRMNL